MTPNAPLPAAGLPPILMKGERKQASVRFIWRARRQSSGLNLGSQKNIPHRRKTK